MTPFCIILSLLLGYVLGYQACIWEFGIKFDKRGRRIR